MCGIEAHVCILQTVLSLSNDGYDVFVVADAVSSQRAHDRAIAFERMKSISNSQVVLTTMESCIFELMQDATHPKFKEMSKLLKETNALGCEFNDEFTGKK